MCLFVSCLLIRTLVIAFGAYLYLVWASPVAQLVENLPVVCETWFVPWVGKIPWRRERIPILVFWAGEFHELYSLWGHKESDTTEQLSLSLNPV